MAPSDKDDASRLTEDQAGKLEEFRATLEALGTAPDDKNAVDALWEKAQYQFSDLSQSLQQSNVEIIPRDEQSYRRANDEDRNLMALDVFSVGAPTIDGISAQDRTKAIRYLGAIAYCGSLSSSETHDVRGASASSDLASLRNTQKQGREFFSAIDSDALSPVNKLSLTAATSVEPIAKISIEVKSSNMKADVENFNTMAANAREELANGGISQASVDSLKKFVFSHSDRAFMAATTSAGLSESDANLARSSFMTLLKLFKLSPKPSPEFIEKALNGQAISREEIGGVYESHQEASQRKSEQRAADNAANRKRRGSGTPMSTPEEAQSATPDQVQRPATPTTPNPAAETNGDTKTDAAPRATADAHKQESAPPKQTVADLEGVGPASKEQEIVDIERIKDMSEPDRTALMLDIIKKGVVAEKFSDEEAKIFEVLSQFDYQNQICANFARLAKSGNRNEIKTLLRSLKSQQEVKQPDAEHPNGEQSATNSDDLIAENCKLINRNLRDSRGGLTGTGQVVMEWMGRVKDGSDRANLAARENKVEQAARANDTQGQQTSAPGSVGFFQGISNMVGGVGTAIGRTADHISRKISGANPPQTPDERLARNTLAFDIATHSASVAYGGLVDAHEIMQSSVLETEAAMQNLHTVHEQVAEMRSEVEHRSAHVLRGLPYNEGSQADIVRAVQNATTKEQQDALPEALKPAIERYQSLDPEEKQALARSFSNLQSASHQQDELKKKVGAGRDSLAKGLSGYAQAIDRLDGCSDLSQTQIESLREQAEDFKDKVMEIEKTVHEAGMTESPEIEAERQAALQKAMEKIMRVLEKMLEKVRSMFRSGPSRGGPVPS